MVAILTQPAFLWFYAATFFLIAELLAPSFIANFFFIRLSRCLLNCLVAGGKFLLANYYFHHCYPRVTYNSEKIMYANIQWH